MIDLNNKAVNFIKFPSGETHFRTSGTFIADYSINTSSYNEIKLIYQSNDDMINLMLLDNFLDSRSIRTHLYCPYLPSSRQDRTQLYEANALQVYSSILNNLKSVTSISYLDPHSLAAPTALIKHNFEDSIKLPNIITNLTDPVYVAPDLGAVKRVQQLAGSNPVLIANKRRDYLTGNITGMELLNHNNNFHGKPFVVIDDICDGGRTFIELAKLLRQTYGDNINLYLHVSHGFFTKGIDILYSAGYTSVTCTNDMRKPYDYCCC